MNRLYVLVLAGAVSLAHGQETGDRDFWHSLDESERIVFIQGVFSGLRESLEVMSKEARRQRSQDRYWVSPFVHEQSIRTLNDYFPDGEKFDYSSIAGHLDAFYSNPDNAHIGMMVAIRIIMLHRAGETRRANELLLIKQKEILKGR